MTPIDLRLRLLADHKRIERLCELLQEAFDADDAREDVQHLWSELDRSVEAHFVLEEGQLFPRYARFDLTETNALRAEHEVLRAQLAELGAGVDLKLVRADVAENFLATLRAHAAREDAALYRWASEMLRGEAQDIAAALLHPDSDHGVATGL